MTSLKRTFDHFANSITTNDIKSCASEQVQDIRQELIATQEKKIKLDDNNNKNFTVTIFNKSTVGELSESQQKILTFIECGYNVFFTGGAGVGKSYVVNFIIKKLSEMKHLQTTSSKKPISTWSKKGRVNSDDDNDNNNVSASSVNSSTDTNVSKGIFITAHTGIAAVQISGTTLNKFAGIGIGKGTKQELLASVLKNTQARENWKNCKALVIDEISMVHPDIFDKLDYIARRIKGNHHKSFGGIQLIICGDFLQLPSPSKPDEEKPSKQSTNPEDRVKYCYDSKAWEDAKFKIVHLKKVFRQNESNLIEALNKVRINKVDDATNRLFQSRVVGKKIPETKSGIKPTTLYSLRKEVTRENELELNKLPGEAKRYEMKVHAQPGRATKASLNYITTLKENCPAPEILTLKVGAQVMLVKNKSVINGLVNGSRGIVVGFEDEEKSGASYPMVKFLDGEVRQIIPEAWETKFNGKTVAKVTQVPLILAWSLTIHKCQGMSLDCVYLSLTSAFEFGQAYVALSRCTSLDGLYLEEWDPRKIRAHSKAIEFYSKIIESK